MVGIVATFSAGIVHLLDTLWTKWIFASFVWVADFFDTVFCAIAGNDPANILCKGRFHQFVHLETWEDVISLTLILLVLPGLWVADSMEQRKKRKETEERHAHDLRETLYEMRKDNEAQLENDIALIPFAKDGYRIPSYGPGCLGSPPLYTPIQGEEPRPWTTDVAATLLIGRTLTPALTDQPGSVYVGCLPWKFIRILTDKHSAGWYLRTAMGVLHDPTRVDLYLDAQCRVTRVVHGSDLNCRSE
jgi:hypothetical protein